MVLEGLGSRGLKVRGFWVQEVARRRVASKIQDQP